MKEEKGHLLFAKASRDRRRSARGSSARATVWRWSNAFNFGDALWYG